MSTDVMRPFSSEDEGERNGVPYGLLMWGQAGIYNAVDDRMIIAALSDSMIGVVRPTSLTPGPGLTLNVAAGWLGVADCGDGTSAVVGSRQTHSLTETGGPPSGTRIDHVWIDTLPNDGEWEMRLVPEGQTIGRPGMSLGRVIVPAGANLASQMTFDRLVPTIGRHADALLRRVNGTTWTNISPDYPIAPTSIRPARTFRVYAYGMGRQGPTLGNIRFRSLMPTSPYVLIAPSGWLAAREQFQWEAEVLLQVTNAGNRFRSKVSATVTRWTQESMTAGTSTPARSITAVRTNWGFEGNADLAWSTIQLQASFGTASSGQLIEALGSTYDTFEPYGV